MHQKRIKEGAFCSLFLFIEPFPVIEHKIEDLLQQKFTEQEFSDCFIIDIQLSANDKLVVYLDSDSGVTFDKCRKISRFLEEKIEASNWLGEKYVLEVSSPGINRPLKFLRQYKKNVGRKVEITMEDGEVKKGILLNVKEDLIILESKEKEKRKKAKIVEVEIPFKHIKKTVVKPSFK